MNKNLTLIISAEENGDIIRVLRELGKPRTLLKGITETEVIEHEVES